MRQFDVFVLNRTGNSELNRTTNSGLNCAAAPEPPFTDPALGWFYTDSFNKRLNESDAEWIVFADSSIDITRDFLNNLAETISAFPMVDAFAPRIRCEKTGVEATDTAAEPAQENGLARGEANVRWESGFILDKKQGVKPIPEDSKIRYAAGPSPRLAAFSRRIVQRTGAFDESLPIESQLLDYSLRMLHAGGKMFYVPYLVANEITAFANNNRSNAKKSNVKGLSNISCAKNLIPVLYKSLGFGKVLPLILRKPSTIMPILKNRKELGAKRDKATVLTKLKENFLKELY